MRVKPVYDGCAVKLANAAGEMEDLGSLMLARNVSRLVAVKAFLYTQDAGQISVRLECKGRGSEAGYWVAYKRIAGKLRKAYICEAYALDPYNLDEAARRLPSDHAIG
jgi:hypothetical protein